MTREEAIQILRDTPIDIRSTREDDIHTLYATAQNMAIEALQEVQKHEETFEWCTDCKEYDKDNYCCHRWSKMIRNTVEELKEYSGLVRCKDCRFYWGNLSEDDTDEMYGECRWDSDEMPNADDFCSYGERREP